MATQQPLCQSQVRLDKRRRFRSQLVHMSLRFGSLFKPSKACTQTVGLHATHRRTYWDLNQWLQLFLSISFTGRIDSELPFGRCIHKAGIGICSANTTLSYRVRKAESKLYEAEDTHNLRSENSNDGFRSFLSLLQVASTVGVFFTNSDIWYANTFHPSFSLNQLTYIRITMEAVDRFAKLKSGKTTSGCVETLLLITTVVLYWLRSYGCISVPKFYAQWSIRKSPIQGGSFTCFRLQSSSLLRLWAFFELRPWRYLH